MFFFCNDVELVLLKYNKNCKQKYEFSFSLQ